MLISAPTPRTARALALAGLSTAVCLTPLALRGQASAERCDSLAAVVQGQRLPGANPPGAPASAWWGLTACYRPGAATGRAVAQAALLSPALLTEPQRERFTLLWELFALRNPQSLYDVVYRQLASGAGEPAYRSALMEGLGVMVGIDTPIRILPDGGCGARLGYTRGWPVSGEAPPPVPASRVEGAAALLRQLELSAPRPEERTEAGCWLNAVGVRVPIRTDRILLTYMCGTTFRVRNSNYNDVIVRGDVYGTDETAEHGADALSDTFFDAGEVGTVRLFLGNQLIQTKANGRKPCP